MGGLHHLDRSAVYLNRRLWGVRFSSTAFLRRVEGLRLLIMGLGFRRFTYVDRGLLTCIRLRLTDVRFLGLQNVRAV